MTDQFSRDHYRDSRQPGENSSRRRVNANPNLAPLGTTPGTSLRADAPLAPGSKRAPISRVPPDRGAHRRLARTRAAPRPLAESSPANAAGCGPARNHASSSAGRPAAQGNVRPASYNRSRAQANRNNPGQRRRLQRLLPLHRAPLEAPVLLPSALWRCLSSPSALRVLCFESAHFRHHRQRSEAHRFQRYDHRQAHRRRTCLPDGGQPARR